jgi:hypothetical protein
LLGIALTIEKRINIRFSTSLLYGVISISILLYIGALLNYLEIAATSIRIIGWIGLVAGYQSFKNRQPKPDEFYIFLSVLGFYIFCQTEPYSIFPFIDDYSHWGRMSQLITENNRLIINTDLVGHKDYPPIAALFHYFFTNFSGYKDKIAIYANGLLLIIFSSPLLIPISNYVSKEKKKVFILTSLSIYSLFWILGLGLHSLWADLLLGFVFGIVLYLYFNCGWKDKDIALIAAIPLLLYIVQIKQIGILFAIFALTIIGLDYLKYGNKKTFIKLSIVFAILIALLIFEWSWKNYITSHEISRGFKADITITNIISAINPVTASERQSITTKRFIDYLFFSHHLSTYWFLTSLILMCGLMVAVKKSNVNTSILPYVTIYAIFTVYMFILLLLYFFSFSDYEGPRLASIDRYTLTYILGMLIFIGGSLIATSSFEKTKNYKLFLIITAILIILPNAGRIILDTLRVGLNTTPQHTAATITAMSQYIKEKTSENAKIYIIWSEGSNDEGVIFSYYLRPRKNNSKCIFIKPPKSPKDADDIWSCQLTVEQFKDTISNYDYLFLANPSQEFINFYLKNLGIEYNSIDSRLFKIKNENEFQLTKVQ